ALDDRLEHRLSVIERIADDAEYPRGRRLLLQRLSKIVRALAQFVEQAAVLDSDDRLIGEARDQLDLLVSEGTNVLAVNADHADELVLLQHRDGHKGPGTAIFCDRRVGAFRRHVCDLDRPHCVDCVSKVRGRQARRFFAEFRKLTWRVMQRDALKFIAFDQQHRAERRLANTRRVRQYSLEHWLERTRRARYDVQHLGGRSLLPSASASSRLHDSSCCSRSARGLRPRAFVPVERSLRPYVRLLAPLRDEVT